ncbi:MAG: TonB-dependent receptor plug domain-containing protein, partial [Gemmatimonadaceae bacterium]
MRGNFVRLLSTLAVFFSLAPALSSQVTEAQPTGPRFLYAAAENAAPTPIDVSRIAILHMRLSLDLEGVSVKRAIAVISEQSGISVWYRDEILRPGGVVNLKARDITLAAALTSVLVESGVDVVFGRDGNATLIAQPAPLSGSLTGRVVDSATRQPLENVAVSVGNRTARTNTDASGKYTLASLQQGTTVTLHFRRLGYFEATMRAPVPDGAGTVPDVAMEAAPSGLDRIVVTGTVIPTSVRALPSPITIITAKDIEQQNITSLDQVFNYMVPGGVSRDDAPGIGGYANFSVRGTTDLSSGTSTIKVLVDGVELDDPSRIRNIDPNSVERIEIVSGPQASTIYGSGASSGVMQIFTKHGSNDASGPVVSGKMQVGTMAHKYNPDDTPVRKDASLAVSGGSNVAGYTVDGSWHGEGAFEKYRKGEQRDLHGGVHFDQGIISGNLSLRDTRIGYHQGLNLLDPVAIAQGRPVADVDPGSRYEYQISTLAGSITLQPIAGWRNTITLGSDDNTFTTFNRSSTVGGPDAVNETNSTARSMHFTSAYDHSMGQAFNYSVVAGGDRIDYVYTDFSGGSRTANHLNGIFAQAQLAWRESLYLTGGLHGDQSPGEDGTYWSPRIGLAFVHSHDAMTF